MSQIRPRSDWALVLLDPVPSEGKTPGGILLNHPVLIRKATVLAVGPGRRYVDGAYLPTQIKVQDRVAFLSAVLESRQGRQLAHLLEQDQALIRETDVLFVIEEGDPLIEK